MTPANIKLMTYWETETHIHAYMVNAIGEKVEWCNEGRENDI